MELQSSCRCDQTSAKIQTVRVSERSWVTELTPGGAGRAEPEQAWRSTPLPTPLALRAAPTRLVLGLCPFTTPGCLTSVSHPSTLSNQRGDRRNLQFGADQSEAQGAARDLGLASRVGQTCGTSPSPVGLTLTSGRYCPSGTEMQDTRRDLQNPLLWEKPPTPTFAGQKCR